MTTPLDHEYRAKLEAAIVRAIFQVSTTEVGGARPALVMTAEVTEALTTVLASLVASSEAVATPRGRREIGEQVGKALQRRIAAFQQHAATHGSPFRTVSIGEGGPC
jgi:hypothetical protein